MINEQPSYYAIIPANVRYDNSLKANEKLLYGEITCLSQSSGKCFATNSYFSNLYGVSKTSISKWISNLVKCGYVKSVVKYRENTKQIEVRYLTIVQHPIEEKLKGGIEEKLKDNNTSINITSSIDGNSVKDFWNEAMDNQVRVIDEKRKSTIKARYKTLLEAKPELKDTPPHEAINKLIEYVTQSDFLMGRVKSSEGKEWKITFDWLFKPTNFIKVIEGNYHD